MYEVAMVNEDESKPEYAIVTGTPGIGKSAFLYYVYWRLVKAKKHVFFVTQCVYFNGAIMWDYNSMPLCSDLQFWTNDLWCLTADPTKMLGLPFDDCLILLAVTVCHDYLR